MPGPEGEEVRGYHKPIMLAGGLGNVRPRHVEKARGAGRARRSSCSAGRRCCIGLGGGAASSMAAGKSHEELDFASVQRDNPEMQRRCQEVIDRCCALGERNPILSIHDVGRRRPLERAARARARRGRGARLELRAIPSDEPGMSPLEIWCNEAQERYVLALAAERLGALRAICERERCPFAVVGEATRRRPAHWSPIARSATAPIDLPLEVVLGKPPRMRARREATSAARPAPLRALEASTLARGGSGACCALPAVADKTFLVTIGDRTVGGPRRSRDPMVGPWQVPVADAAVTLASFDGYAGEAMAIGERTPVALLDAAASARLAVGEALTNLALGARRGALRREALGELDGGRRPSRARTRALRRRARGRHGALPGARDRDPGRQGLALDAHGVGRRRRAAQS